jgi:hypothetical protein
LLVAVTAAVCVQGLVQPFAFSSRVAVSGPLACAVDAEVRLLKVCVPAPLFEAYVRAGLPEKSDDGDKVIVTGDTLEASAKKLSVYDVPRLEL